MAGLQKHRRGAPGIQGLLPSFNANAPTITRAETWELEFGPRRRQVISRCPRELEKLQGHLGADRVQSVIIGPGPAEPIPIEPCQRLIAAGCERPTEDIGRHKRGVAAFPRSVNRIIRLSTSPAEWTRQMGSPSHNEQTRAK